MVHPTADWPRGDGAQGAIRWHVVTHDDTRAPEETSVSSKDEGVQVRLLATSSSPRQVLGGGDAYADFVQFHVRPFVEQRYAAPSVVGLMGSSLGEFRRRTGIRVYRHGWRWPRRRLPGRHRQLLREPPARRRSRRRRLAFRGNTLVLVGSRRATQRSGLVSTCAPTDQALRSDAVTRVHRLRRPPELHSGSA